MSRQSPQQRIVFGCVLALLGVLFLLDNFHVFEARKVLAFWPVVFIVAGGLKLAQARHPAGYLVGGAFVLLGVVMTLAHMGVITVRWRDWWPVLLIGFGLLVIFKGQLRNGLQGNADGGDAETTLEPRVDLTVVMGGSELKVGAQEFRGGDITVVMGSVELDLRQASISGEARLDVFVAMGGIDIRIPTDWAVTINGVPLLAGIEDKSVPPAQPVKRLIITGYLLMGGLEIKN